MKPVKVVLGLSKLKPIEKVTFWGTIKIDMTGNGNFGAPNPALATIDAEVDTLALAIIAALSGDHSKVVAMHAQEDIVVNLMEQLGNYVEQTANAALLTGRDAESIVASAGMEVEGGRSKAPVPNAPKNLKGISVVEGEIKLSWTGEEHARAYIIYLSNDISLANTGTGNVSTNTTTAKVFANWDMTDVCHKPEIVLNDLVSGTKYGVRIVCSGTAGKSEASNVIVVKVL